MGANVYPITLGFDHAYIIQDHGTIMVDGGAPKQAKAFTRALADLSINPEEIQLIVLTHGHWDHIGSAREIKEITGARIAMHQKERAWLETSQKPMPPGVTLWGHIFGGIIKAFLPLVSIPATPVDVVLGDSPLPLSEYGVSGRVFHTPGHSPGSVSILLDTGEAFVGDLAMNKFPLRFSPGLPIFAEDWDALVTSWEILIDQGAKTVYPAHGDPFSVDIIQNALKQSLS
ncbi:MAG: MBL fold metallo-hydrolase [Deltaproteobacteria bacterium]|nr:MBL fold metallo-hydrolase [Deltaproteobacteria bacterium]